IERRDDEVPVADLEGEALENAGALDDAEPDEIANCPLGLPGGSRGVDDALAAGIEPRNVGKRRGSSAGDEIVEANGGSHCLPIADDDHGHAGPRAGNRGRGLERGLGDEDGAQPSSRGDALELRRLGTRAHVHGACAEAHEREPRDDVLGTVLGRQPDRVTAADSELVAESGRRTIDEAIDLGVRVRPPGIDEGWALWRGERVQGVDRAHGQPGAKREPRDQRRGERMQLTERLDAPGHAEDARDAHRRRVQPLTKEDVRAAGERAPNPKERGGHCGAAVGGIIADLAHDRADRSLGDAPPSSRAIRPDATDAGTKGRNGTGPSPTARCTRSNQNPACRGGRTACLPPPPSSPRPVSRSIRDRPCRPTGPPDRCRRAAAPLRVGASARLEPLGGPPSSGGEGGAGGGGAEGSGSGSGSTARGWGGGGGSDGDWSSTRAAQLTSTDARNTINGDGFRTTALMLGGAHQATRKPSKRAARFATGGSCLARRLCAAAQGAPGRTVRMTRCAEDRARP